MSEAKISGGGAKLLYAGADTGFPEGGVKHPPWTLSAWRHPPSTKLKNTPTLGHSQAPPPTPLDIAHVTFQGGGGDRSRSRTLCIGFQYQDKFKGGGGVITPTPPPPWIRHCICILSVKCFERFAIVSVNSAIFIGAYIGVGRYEFTTGGGGGGQRCFSRSLWSSETLLVWCVAPRDKRGSRACTTVSIKIGENWAACRGLARGIGGSRIL